VLNERWLWAVAFAAVPAGVRRRMIGGGWLLAWSRRGEEEDQARQSAVATFLTQKHSVGWWGGEETISLLFNC